MTTKHDLDMLDRATLRAWRAWNSIKWSGAALAAAFAVATAFFLTLSLFPDFTLNLSSRSGILLHTLILTVPTVLSAITIGVVIGRHVVAHAFVTAAIVALIHLFFSTWVVVRGLNLSAPFGYYFMLTPIGRYPSAEMASMVLMITLELYVAAVVARRMWEKRPRALRAA